MKDYRVLFNELKLYRGGMLLEKPSLIALNKLDLSDESYVEEFEMLKKHAHAPVVPISAKDGQNLGILMETLREMVEAEK